MAIAELPGKPLLSPPKTTSVAPITLTAEDREYVSDQLEIARARKDGRSLATILSCSRELGIKAPMKREDMGIITAYLNKERKEKMPAWGIADIHVELKKLRHSRTITPKDLERIDETLADYRGHVYLQLAGERGYGLGIAGMLSCMKELELPFEVKDSDLYAIRREIASDRKARSTYTTSQLVQKLYALQMLGYNEPLTPQDREWVLKALAEDKEKSSSSAVEMIAQFNQLVAQQTTTDVSPLPPLKKI